MKLKTESFNRHTNVKEILANMDSTSVDINLSSNNPRFKFTVKVGEKFAYRTKNPIQRYDLSVNINYFHSEVQARECLAYFKNKGAKLDKEMA